MNSPLDATRVTLGIEAGTGVDGDTFKNSYLMDKFGIQINKTSRNTVLFMDEHSARTTRSSVAYLIEVLVQIANELDEGLEDSSPIERRAFEKRVAALTQELPALAGLQPFSRLLPQRRQEQYARRGHPRCLFPFL